jgi:hypothetical protein
MDLFQRQDQTALASIWAEGHSLRKLHAIVSNSTLDSRTRFLAAEVLFTKCSDYPPADVVSDLVGIYAAALQHAPESMANPWGLPGDPSGQIAQHVIRLGESAIPALCTMLDDSRIVKFGGSKEATFANSYDFRVKDIAASLIARILNLPFVPDTKPTARDKAIQKLAATLK